MNKNNNPRNLKGEDAWKNKLRNDERGHVVFRDVISGYRAGFRDFQSKWLAGKRTLLDICSATAPPDDTVGSLPGREKNDPEAYAKFVADYVGVGYKEKLPDPAKTPALWAKIMKATVQYEQGREENWADLFSGLAWWLRDFVEKDI